MEKAETKGAAFEMCIRDSLKAVPFGLQHILAMFVSNLMPITIIAAAGGLSQAEVAVLLQNAMLVAGIATLI